MPLTHDLPPALITEQFEIAFTDWQHSQVVLQENQSRLVDAVGDSALSQEPDLVWDDTNDLMQSIPLEEIAEGSPEELKIKLNDCMSITLERYAQDQAIITALQQWGRAAVNSWARQGELMDAAKSSKANAFTLFALGRQLKRRALNSYDDLTRETILGSTVALLDKIQVLDKFTSEHEGEFFTNVAVPHGVVTGKLASGGLAVTEKDSLMIPTDGEVYYFAYQSLLPPTQTSSGPTEDIHVWEDFSVNERDLNKGVIKDASELAAFTGWYNEAAWFAGLMPPEGCEIPDEYQEIRQKVFRLGQLAATAA